MIKSFRKKFAYFSCILLLFISLSSPQVALAASTDATLSSITIDRSPMSGFDGSTYTYEFVSEYAVEQIEIGAVATDPNAQITGDTGTQSLSVGLNTFTITCTAEDGVTTQDYVLNFTRGKDPTLSDLTIDGNTVEGFDSHGDYYVLTVDYSTDQIEIGATATDPDAQITGDTGTQSLEVGSNAFFIFCTAEDGLYFIEYTLVITREAESIGTDATLSDLTINSSTVTGFVSDTCTYDITVDYSTDEIDIGATATDTNAQLSGDTGTQSLSIGLNTFTVTCTAQDGATSQDYVLNITRTDSTPSNIDNDGQTASDNDTYKRLELYNGKWCVKGEVLVKLKDTSETKRSQSLSSIDAVGYETIASSKLLKVKLPKGKSVKEYIDKAKNQSNILSIQPNYVYVLDASVNDPLADNDYQWHHDTIGSYDAWDVTMGESSVLVAVLDTGVDVDHPDLSSRIHLHTDVVDNDGSADDDDGHGTHVSGIIAAQANNGQGAAGVAPNCRLIVVDVFGFYLDTDDNIVFAALTSEIIEGINYAVGNGADVMNLSLGSYNEDTELTDVINSAVNNGVVVVCSAGNDDVSTPHYPSDVDAAISVISTNRLDVRSSFSNYGIEKDISAPGGEIPADGTDDIPYEGIVSTYLDGGYASMSGTSQASPMVAGVCALMLSADPTLSVDEIQNILYNSAVDLQQPGKDAAYGWGRMDANAAVHIAAKRAYKVEIFESDIEVQLGVENQITVTVYPENAINKNITWTSSDENIVTVVDGKIMAISVGSATITVTTEDGGYTDTCIVNVLDFNDLFAFDNSTGTITDYYGNASKLIIPNTHEGVIIKAIGNNVFSHSVLTDITLPEGLTSIGSSAFTWCEKLTNLVIPDNVTSMGSSVFANCRNLTNVELGNGIKSIPQSMVHGCINLTNIIMPDSISYIGSYAFCDCNKLNEFTIPSSVTYIGYRAFHNCVEFTNIVLPSIVTIYDSAFEGCTGLESITMGSSLESITFRAFDECSNLDNISVDESNNNFKSIDGVLFDKSAETLLIYPKGNNRLSYQIPQTVNVVGIGSFINNNIISQITIPDNVEIISNSAFYACSNLTEVIGGNGLTSIGISAFKNCLKLKSFQINNVTTIDENAFYDCDSLTEITIPSSVTFLGKYAFNGCGSLKSLYVEEGLVEIPYLSFSGCRSLTKVVLPNSIAAISSSAFDYHHDDLTIYGYAGSYAETYAESNGIPFVALVLSSPTYTINQDTSIISGAPDMTSIADFKANFNNDGAYIKVYDSSDSEVTTGNVGTGMTVKLVINGTVEDELEVCVLGDVNSDGVIDISDYTYVRLKIFDLRDLTGVYFMAGDVNKDGSIDISDYTYVRLDIFDLRPIN